MVVVQMLSKIRIFFCHSSQLGKEFEQKKTKEESSLEELEDWC